MKLLPLLEVLFVNAILVALLFWVSGDYGFRTGYWGSEQFAPSTTRYPLFLITSAVKGSTNIPGLLTIDWQQLIVLVLLVADSVYLRSLYLQRRRSGPPVSE